MQHFLKFLGHPGIRIALAYALFASLWIQFSDAGLRTMVSDPDDLSYWQSVKGEAFILLTTALMFFLASRWHRQQAQEKVMLTERYVYLSKHANDIILLADDQGHIIEANDRACEAYGYTLEELLKKTSRDLRAPGHKESWHKDFEYPANSNGTIFETVQQCSDGRTFPAEVSSRTFKVDGRIYRQAIIRDISDRKMAEARLQRMTHLYAALSECNHAIVSTQSEEELFPLICRIAVSNGNLKMAWIGLVEPDTQRLSVAAAYGDGTEYLDDIQISIDAKSPLGHGPTGTAIREKTPFWCQDFQNDPATAPWHERGQRHGWKASAALPIYRHDEAVGALTLYAGEANSFDSAERNLLIEMALGISHALERFEATRQRQRLQQQIAETKLNMETILSSVDQVIWSVDAKTHQVLYLNSAVENVFGRTAEEFLREPMLWLDVVHGEDRPIATEMDRRLHTEGYAEAEFRIVRPDGKIRWIFDRAHLSRDVQGSPLRLDGVVSDITARKEAEEHIHHLAHFDALTGLPNRTLLHDRISHAISFAQLNRQAMALMFIDLDRFKNVNDSLGHQVGDLVLIKVADRLRKLMHDDDTVSHLSGDEFVLLLPSSDTDSAAHMAEKVIDSISGPYAVDGHELIVTPSIGIAMFPADGQNGETLIQNADAAMFRAKEGGRCAFRFFTPEMHQQASRTLQLENALRRALERDQLILHYQPQMDIASGRIVGCEALLRWSHPELGMISPTDFIPIAEESGLILPIGEWVMREAATQVKRWAGAGLPLLPVAVNLSAVQFRQLTLPSLVDRILKETELPPQYFELELTESITMGDPEIAIGMMQRLHQQGISLSIDDFGTGYSSLSYLRRFNIHKLKIDQSFVRDLTTDPEDEAIVCAIISLAKGLELRTIAEGVETEQQLAFLRSKGCDEIQGYWISRPLPAGDFEALLRTRSGE